MKIGTRLTIGFLAITALIWVTFFFAVNTYTKVGQQFEVLTGDVTPTLITLSDIGLGVSEVSHESREYIYSGDEETKQSVLSTLKQLKNEGLMHLEQHIPLGPEEQRASEELVVKIDTFSLAVVEVINLKEQGMSFEQLLAEDRKADLLARVLIEQLRERKAFDEEKLAASEEAVAEAHISGMKILLLTAGFVTFLAAVIALFITRSIVRPLRALHKGVEEIEQGNFDYKVGTGAKDEIGHLSRHFDQMVEHLKETATSIDNLNKEITERKQAEEALQETEERFRDFFENAPIGFHIFGPDRIITDINQAELDMIGYSYDEIVGEKSWSDLIIPEHRQMFAKHWEEMSKSGRVKDLEYTLIRKDGRRVFVLLNASTRLDSEGKMINTRGSVLDITERKQAEEKLR